MTVSETPRLALTRWSDDEDPPPSRAQFDGDNAAVDDLVAIAQQGILAARPLPGAKGGRTFYLATDRRRLYYDTGSEWLLVAIMEPSGTMPLASAPGDTALEGDEPLVPGDPDPDPATLELALARHRHPREGWNAGLQTEVLINDTTNVPLGTADTIVHTAQIARPPGWASMYVELDGYCTCKTSSEVGMRRAVLYIVAPTGDPQLGPDVAFHFVDPGPADPEDRPVTVPLMGVTAVLEAASTQFRIRGYITNGSDSDVVATRRYVRARKVRVT